MPINSGHESAQEHMASPEFQERLLRDISLIECIQDGFIPALPNEDNPRPLVTDGELTEDAASALGELFENYEPLIHKIANNTYARFQRPPGFSADDLVQEGFYGLFRASLRWDPAKVRGGFLGFARNFVSGQVLRKAQEVSTTIRLPQDQRDDVSKYRSVYWKKYSEVEYSPRRVQLARALGTSVTRVDELAIEEAMTNQMGSIDGGYFNDNREQHSTYGKSRQDRWRPIDPSASEVREVEEEILILEIQEIVNEAIDPKSENGLTDQEAAMLRLRFFGKDGFPMTLEEVGKEFGVSRERVRQVEAKTLSKLRHPMYANKLRDLLSAA